MVVSLGTVSQEWLIIPQLVCDYVCHFSGMLYANLSVEFKSSYMYISFAVLSNTSCNPGTKPTLPELLKFTCPDGRVVSIPVEIATKYVQFGTFLLDDRNGSRVEITARKHHYDAEQINIDIFQEWLTGRGKQPVTWATLVEVLRDIELSTLAGDISTSKCPSEPVLTACTEILEIAIMCVCVCYLTIISYVSIDSILHYAVATWLPLLDSGHFAQWELWDFEGPEHSGPLAAVVSCTDNKLSAAYDLVACSPSSYRTTILPTLTLDLMRLRKMTTLSLVSQQVPCLFLCC